VGGPLQVILIKCQSHFEQFPSLEIVLVFHARYVDRLDVVGVRKLRTLRREARILIVEMVHEEAGCNDVAAGDVGLELGQVADTQKVIIVCTRGKFGEDNIVVFSVDRIIEPHLPFL
jgi:hypothetical protein